jgi:hypothetical protein
MSGINNPQYESGLEVVEAERSGWAEVAPPGMKDKKEVEKPILVSPAQYSVLSPDIDYRNSYLWPPRQQTQEQKVMAPKPTIWGLRQKVFYTVLAVGILAAVAAVAIGVGTGIAFGHKSGGDSPPAVA